ncbi:MAG: peptidylprolyl isomerase [Nitrospiraceae bacterium]|nr:peptidylprolyl isomerase [Nitrospiraceae bacterium]
MTAKNGDTVKVHYTGKFDDGFVFDSSDGREPLEFTIGKHQVIKGFEEGVEGMSVGESKSIKISSDEAYGPRHENLMLRFRRDQFPPNIKPEVGLTLQLRQPDGGILDVMVTGITEEKVTLDANHPLAGKDLNFDVKLVEIKD